MAPAALGPACDCQVCHEAAVMQGKAVLPQLGPEVCLLRSTACRPCWMGGTLPHHEAPQQPSL